MRIAISAESTIDLPKEQLERFDIHTLPFTLIMGDESVLDGEIQPEKLFEFTEKQLHMAPLSPPEAGLFIFSAPRKYREAGYTVRHSCIQP